MVPETIAAIDTAATSTTRVLGEPYAFWAQTCVLFFAAVLALLAIIDSRKTARRKAAVDAIAALKRDEAIEKAVLIINGLHDGDTNIGSFAKKEKFSTPESKSICYVLNHYEHVCVGIDQGIYDEVIFRNTMHTHVVKLYEKVKPFIEEARRTSGKETTFQDFEILACRWKNHPLKHKKVVSRQA
jgi:hypothetical protein